MPLVLVIWKVDKIEEPKLIGEVFNVDYSSHCNHGSNLKHIIYYLHLKISINQMGHNNH
jgi:hypothetical protein